MKPTAPAIALRNRAESSAHRVPVRFPKTDCQYLAGSTGDFSGGRNGRRCASLRAITEDYFKHEARAHFASEAAFFGVIVISAAIPIVEGIRGLISWVL